MNWTAVSHIFIPLFNFCLSIRANSNCIYFLLCIWVTRQAHDTHFYRKSPVLRIIGSSLLKKIVNRVINPDTCLFIIWVNVSIVANGHYTNISTLLVPYVLNWIKLFLSTKKIKQIRNYIPTSLLNDTTQVINYGVRENVYLCLKEYATNRQQFTSTPICNTVSETCTVTSDKVILMCAFFVTV